MTPLILLAGLVLLALSRRKPAQAQLPADTGGGPSDIVPKPDNSLAPIEKGLKQSALVVGIVGGLAKALGLTWAGLLAALPIILLVTAIILYAAIVAFVIYNLLTKKPDRLQLTLEYLEAELPGVQSRARNKFNESWQKIHDETKAKLIANQPPVFSKQWTHGPNNIQNAERVAIPFADGFMKKTNELAYKAWVAKQGTRNNIIDTAFNGMAFEIFAGELDPIDGTLTHPVPVWRVDPNGYYAASGMKELPLADAVAEEFEYVGYETANIVAFMNFMSTYSANISDKEKAKIGLNMRVFDGYNVDRDGGVEMPVPSYDKRGNLTVTRKFVSHKAMGNGAPL